MELAPAAVNVSRALELAPDNAEVLIAASELTQAQEQPDKARAYLRHGKELFPQDVRFYRELALFQSDPRIGPNVQEHLPALLALVRHKGTAVLGERAVSLDPGNAVAWRNLGIGCFNVAGDSEKAHDAYDRAVSADPEDARRRYNRGSKCGWRPAAAMPLASASARCFRPWTGRDP